MKISSNYKENIELFHSNLAVKESFDIVERTIIIGGRHAVIYYLEGFLKDNIMQEILKVFFNVPKEVMDSYVTVKSFTDNEIPHVSVSTQTELTPTINLLLTGQSILFVDGYDCAIIMDLRNYAGRSTAEPTKEKTLRGAKDGFIEKLVFNTALIRRRIRDPRLICDMHSIGNISKTDVCLVYMDGIVDQDALGKILLKLNNVNINALTVADQSLIDVLITKNKLSPFPKVRYTERPDIAAAHIIEGKIIILVDNSPTAMIVPTGLWDFTQDVNDYYFPLFTGNYLRLIRNMVTIANLLLIPLYILIVNRSIVLPDYFDFLFPAEAYVVPMTIQFLILEFAIDGLKLASLSTPETLGSSLSVVGGLILGQFAVATGWFTNQSILYMAVVSIAGFSQPNIEMNYALKFLRTLLIILCGLFGSWGLIGGIVICIIIMARTKTLTDTPYFYPLIPFNWKKLKNLIFRTIVSNDVQKKIS